MPGATLALGILYWGKPSKKPLESAVNSVTLTRPASSKCNREVDEHNTQSRAQEPWNPSVLRSPHCWDVCGYGWDWRRSRSWKSASHLWKGGFQAVASRQILQEARLCKCWFRDRMVSFYWMRSPELVGRVEGWNPTLIIASLPQSCAIAQSSHVWF